MKKYFLTFCILFFIEYCFCQNVDSIINILEGKWNWYRTYGGYAGQEITPEEKGYTINVEFLPSNNDSVQFLLYKNDTLEKNILTNILYTESCFYWGINKNVIPVLGEYFSIVSFVDYLCIVFDDSNHFKLCEPLIVHSYWHYFEREINNTIQKNNNECLINIYPNPHNDYIYVVGLPEGILSIEIFDIAGRNAYKVTIKNRESYCIRPIGLSKGIYFIRITNSSKKELLLFQQIIKI